MRIALISLYDVENYAVRVLANYLRTAGQPALEVYFKDWKNNAFVEPTAVELEHLAAGIRRFEADIVGLSLRASAYFTVCRTIAEYLRRELDVPILLGGVHPTVKPDETLEFADYVVRGEAEEATLELLQRLDAGKPAHDIPNICTTLDGQPVINDVRPLVQDLSGIMRRDFLHPDKLVIDGRNRYRKDPIVQDPIYLIACSRGCPFRCSFCYNSAIRDLVAGKGDYYRLRPVDDVMAELAEATRSYGNLKRIRFDDEVFPTDRSWLEAFLPRYRREIGLPFECFLESRVVDRSLLESMVEAGLDVVYTGIQANDRVSRSLYQREADNSVVLRVAKLYKEFDLKARYHIMVDDPATGERDRVALFELLNSIPRPFQLYLFSMTVMPGTELASRLLEEGEITDDQVEGKATKTFQQYRVSLEWTRDPEDLFWVSMLTLVNKPWMSPTTLRRMFYSTWLRQHPRTVAQLAGVSNAVAMAGRIPLAFQQGEFGLRVLRRFWTPEGWITA